MSSPLGFRPPLFSKFGKNLKDLLNKKYDYSNELVVKNRLQDVSVESTVTLGNELGSYTGNVKATHTSKKFGDTEVEANTKGYSSLEVKANKFHDNLTINAKGVQKDSLSSKVGLEYSQDNVSATADYSYDSNHNVEGSLVAGFDGLSVGGMTKYDVTKGEVADFNFGSQYSTSVYTATLKTEKKADTLLASFFHNVPSTTNLRTQIGAQFSWDLTNEKRVLCVGVEHDVCPHTLFKAKAATCGTVDTVIEHKLSNPNLKVALSSSWNSKSSRPDKFGIGLTFGEF